jgi:hypothetical protein
VTPWTDCPTCPACGGPVGIGIATHGRGADLAWAYPEARLACPACGHAWVGSDADVAQAAAADAAWEIEDARERGERSEV